MSNNYGYHLGVDANIHFLSERPARYKGQSDAQPKTKLTSTEAIQLLDRRLITELKMQRAAPERTAAVYPQTLHHDGSSDISWFCPKADHRNAFYVSLLEERSGDLSVTLFERGSGHLGGSTGFSYSFATVEAFMSVLDLLDKRADSRLSHIDTLPSSKGAVSRIRGRLRKFRGRLGNWYGAIDQVSPRVETIRKGLLAIVKSNQLPVEEVHPLRRRAGQRITPIRYNASTGIPHP